MYMAFTEEDGRKIRKKGFTVIEFKNCIRNGICASGLIVMKAISIFTEALATLATRIREIVDDLEFYIEDSLVKCGYPPSKRYKFVRLMDSWGLNKYEVWRKTRHTWLARSDC